MLGNKWGKMSKRLQAHNRSPINVVSFLKKCWCEDLSSESQDPLGRSARKGLRNQRLGGRCLSVGKKEDLGGVTKVFMVGLRRRALLEPPGLGWKAGEHMWSSPCLLCTSPVPVPSVTHPSTCPDFSHSHRCAQRPLLSASPSLQATASAVCCLPQPPSLGWRLLITWVWASLSPPCCTCW